MIEPKYYECHITVEPCFDEKLETLKIISQQFGFQVADLLFKRRKEETETRSDKDSFCTGRDEDYKILKIRMDNLVDELTFKGFQVWRKKIEAVLFDERVR